MGIEFRYAGLREKRHAIVLATASLCIAGCVGETIDAETRIDEAGELALRRCGTPDRQSGAPGEAGFVLLAGRWPAQHQQLTYSFGELSGDLDAMQIRQIFRSAMDLWSAVIPVTFSEAAAGRQADVQIAWQANEHGDGHAFNQALAHAFPPVCEKERCTALSGDFHLSANCRWQVTKADGVQTCDLRHVALHELGHVLGLDHSRQADSVMRATYNHMLELGADDIAGVQHLYGSTPAGDGKIADPKVDDNAGGLASSPSTACSLGEMPKPSLSFAPLVWLLARWLRRRRFQLA